MDMEEIVIAVDPGREKCGVAVVGRRTGLVEKSVVPAGQMAAVVAALAEKYAAAVAVLGDRTGHKGAMTALAALRPGGREISVSLVDEHRSTDEARARYWRDHPPRGLARLIPVTLRVPPVPVDDYVAVIIAERYFRR